MSGYLQRLVQTVAQPVQAVHPLAGSIFAPNHDESIERTRSLKRSVIADPSKDSRWRNFTTSGLVRSTTPRRDTTPPLPDRYNRCPFATATPLPT